jgi:hypothetical protein
MLLGARCCGLDSFLGKIEATSPWLLFATHSPGCHDNETIFDQVGGANWFMLERCHTS